MVWLMLDALSILLGLCVGAGVAGTLLTIWHFKEVERLIKLVEAVKAVNAVNVDQRSNWSIDRSNRSKGAVKPVKLNEAVNVEAVNIDRDGSSITARTSQATLQLLKASSSSGEQGSSDSSAPPRRGSSQRDPEALKAEILRLRGQGLSTREIARQLGCSHSLVVYYLKKMS
jgi:DNA-binding CsgD family transcriptional regulator